MKSISVIFIILFIMLIPAVSAVSITASPDHIQEGSQVSVQITGLEDGSAFSMQINGEFDVKQGEEFSFGTNNLVIPISLDNGEISAYTKGTKTTTLNVKAGKTISVTDESDDQGIFRTTQEHNISSGTYELLSLSGKVADDTTTLVSELEMTGIKRGPEDAEISFAAEGITNGTLTITCYVDNHEEMNRKIIIGSPSPTKKPETPHSFSSGGDSSAVSSTQTPADERTSTDGIARLSGRIGDAKLLKVVISEFPDDWEAVTGAYLVTGDLEGSSQISFRIPEEFRDSTLFIASSENGKWSPAHSLINNNEISTSPDEGSTYALMAFAAPATTTSTQRPMVTETTPATETKTPTPAATRSGLSPLVALGALSLLIAVIWRRD